MSDKPPTKRGILSSLMGLFGEEGEEGSEERGANEAPGSAVSADAPEQQGGAEVQGNGSSNGAGEREDDEDQTAGPIAGPAAGTAVVRESYEPGWYAVSAARWHQPSAPPPTFEEPTAPVETGTPAWEMSPEESAPVDARVSEPESRSVDAAEAAAASFTMTPEEIAEAPSEEPQADQPAAETAFAASSVDETFEAPFEAPEAPDTEQQSEGEPGEETLAGPEPEPEWAEPEAAAAAEWTAPDTEPEPEGFEPAEPEVFEAAEPEAEPEPEAELEVFEPEAFEAAEPEPEVFDAAEPESEPELEVFEAAEAAHEEAGAVEPAAEAGESPEETGWEDGASIEAAVDESMSADTVEVPMPLPDPDVAAAPVAPAFAAEPPGLASRVAAERRRALEEMMARGIADVDVAGVSRLLQDPERGIRLLALEALRSRPDAVEPDAVSRALRDPSDEVRAAAVRLAASTQHHAVPEVFPLVAERQWPAAQQAALEVLPRSIALNGIADDDLDSMLGSIARMESHPNAAERSGFAALAGP